MKRDLEIFTTVFTLSLTALTPALAEGEWTQLIANAGLTPAEAEGLSLEQIAIYKFNSDTRPDDSIGVAARKDPVPVDTSAHGQLIDATRLSREEAENMTVREIFAYKLDRDNAEDLHLPTTAAEPVAVDPSKHAHLISAAGLTPEDAAGMSLNSVVMMKFFDESN